MNMKARNSLMTTAPMLLALFATAGCSSMSGVGGSGSYACKAPDGVLCSSVTGIYSNSIQNNLPGQQNARAETAEGAGNGDKVQFVVTPAQAARTALSTGHPIRSAPRILRIWVAPWEDSDGDLRDQSHVYVAVDGGRWMIERNRQNIRDEYSAVAPPPSAAKQDARLTNPAPQRDAPYASKEAQHESE
jgi:conjugal transfer pilus assembly protein TraV